MYLSINRYKTDFMGILIPYLYNYKREKENYK